MISKQEAKAAAERLGCLENSELHTAYKANQSMYEQVCQDEVKVYNWAIKELLASNSNESQEKIEVCLVTDVLDALGVPSTATGGEGDAEVKINVYERLRWLKRSIETKKQQNQELITPEWCLEKGARHWEAGNYYEFDCGVIWEPPRDNFLGGVYLRMNDPYVWKHTVPIKGVKTRKALEKLISALGGDKKPYLNEMSKN